MATAAIFKPALYPLLVDSCQTSPPDVATLLDLCARRIVHDASNTLAAIQVVPSELCYPLMTAALLLSRDRTLEVLVAHWPSPVLTLHKFAPPLFHQVRHSRDPTLSHALTAGMKYTTCLAHTFVECIKQRAPTRLRCLDLTQYPVAEVIVNYLASHVLLAYNERRQNEIIAKYNQLTRDLPESQRTCYDVTNIMPENQYLVLLDARLESRDAHMEACRALRVSTEPACRFRLRPRMLDVNGLGVARVCVLLDQIHSPEDLQGLGLQFNSLKEEGLQLLVPYLQRLSHLTCLDLSYNCLNMPGTEAALLLGRAFAALPRLVRLDLTGNRLKRCYAQVLGPVTGPLRFLGLSFCAAAPEDLSFLASSSAHAPVPPCCAHLQQLHLADNDLGGKARVSELGRLMRARAATLQVLDLSGCQLQAFEWTELLPPLSCLGCLVQLDLSSCDSLTSCDTLHPLLTTLAKLSKLKRLFLAYPDLGNEGEGAMSEEERLQTENALHKAYQNSLLNRVTLYCAQMQRTPYEVVLNKTRKFIL